MTNAVADSGTATLGKRSLHSNRHKSTVQYSNLSTLQSRGLAVSLALAAFCINTRPRENDSLCENQ